MVKLFNHNKQKGKFYAKNLGDEMTFDKVGIKLDSTQINNGFITV